MYVCMLFLEWSVGENHLKTICDENSNIKPDSQLHRGYQAPEENPNRIPKKAVNRAYVPSWLVRSSADYERTRFHDTVYIYSQVVIN